MQKLLFLATLAALLALLACSNPSPTPTVTLTPEQTLPSSPTQEPTPATAPTAAPVKPPATEPTPVPAATEAPEPTVTSTPTPPQTRKDETSAGVLSPLVLDDPMYDDPEAVNALLSQTELACLKEVGPVMHLRWK